MSIAIELVRALPGPDGAPGHTPVDAVGVGVFSDALEAGELPAGLEPGFLAAQGFTAAVGTTCAAPGGDGRLLVALGLGPSAHSFSGLQAPGGPRRWWNRRKLRPYEAAVAAGESPIEGSETLTAGDLALEALLLGLRTCDGIALERFRHLYGVDLTAAGTTNAVAVERLAEDGLLIPRDGRLVPTLRGLSVADFLARSFEV